MGTYLRPTALAEALVALAQGAGEGRPLVIVAGATDHYPARVGRVADEDILDISGLPGMREIRLTAAGWRIPAGSSWTDLVEAPLPPLFDGFRRAARAVGGLGVQNRGTVVGNVCNASPAADGMPNLLALDALVELVSVRGVRRVPVGAFVTGNRSTLRASDELATGLVIPKLGSADDLVASAFLKLGSRAYMVISIAMVAAVIARDARGRIEEARVAIGACSPVAQRLPALEGELVGRFAAPGLGALVRREHLAVLSPIDDVRASGAYRVTAAEVLVRRALEELVT